MLLTTREERRMTESGTAIELVARFSPAVVVPSYNSGPIILPTIDAIAQAAHPRPVLVVLDGCTDGSFDHLQSRNADAKVPVHLLALPENQGKGAAILAALDHSIVAGSSHVLTIDADGQHDATAIHAFFEMGEAHPHDLIMGQPLFQRDAPWIRRAGRRISNFLCRIVTPGIELGDVLFGMRLYPVTTLRQAFSQTEFARRFDFDAEIAVRMIWNGTLPRRLPVPVRYPRAEEGGISHYRYGRDNLCLAAMHIRLLAQFLTRRPPMRRAPDETHADRAAGPTRPPRLS
ncbi:MAG: glycosyltransferase family 2 protein [Verrucomicrobiia bacterium]